MFMGQVSYVHGGQAVTDRALPGYRYALIPCGDAAHPSDPCHLRAGGAARSAYPLHFTAARSRAARPMRACKGKKGPPRRCRHGKYCETTPGAAVAPAAAAAPDHEAGLSRRLPMAGATAAFSRRCAETHPPRIWQVPRPSSFSAPPSVGERGAENEQAGRGPAKVTLKLQKPFAPLPSPLRGEASKEQSLKGELRPTNQRKDDESS